MFTAFANKCVSLTEKDFLHTVADTVIVLRDVVAPSRGI